MNEQLIRFGSTTTTNVSPFVLVFVVLMSLLILFLPRKYVFVPLFFSLFFVPLGQRVVIAGLNFMMFRIMIFAALCRAVFQLLCGGKNSVRLRWNWIDKVFILWVFSSVVTFTTLYGQLDAFVNRMGLFYNAFGVYFPLRVFFQDEEDIDRTVRIFAVICVVIAVCMLSEQFTKRNFFSVFGGVPEFADNRDGNLRSQGPFAHPILAGTFGAVFVPLLLGLWWKKSRSKSIALLGGVSATVIAVASMSSTPIMALVAGVGALFLWPFRDRMRLFRWGLALTLIGLHLVMKAPVWSLIGRAGVIGGSSGYHRYFLVDQFIRRFWEWWLVGTKETASWGYDMWDTSNLYVEIGVTGGLPTLVLFLAIIVCCFKGLGRARRAVEGNPMAEWRLWAVGAALFANLVAFFGITYFDQTSLGWYALLAIISSLSAFALSQPSAQTLIVEDASTPGIPVVPKPSLAVLRTGQRGSYPGIRNTAEFSRDRF